MKPLLAIAATFTAEPVEEALSFWLQELDLQHDIRFAPYSQVLQSILSEDGLLRTNSGGVNVVLLRASDWAAAGAGAIDQLAEAIAEAPSSSDWIVVLCPSAGGSGLDSQAAERLTKRLPFAHFADGTEIRALYPVGEVFDLQTDELGQVPYTQDFFIAMATWIARRIHALRMTPYKVLALDCDNTLWEGICGEDGAGGVTIGPGQRALQEFALAQREAGMLLCLCSKNNEADVLETFRAHREWPLQAGHFAAWRMNWEAKSANIPALAAELGLALDSFIFADDDRRECAEVDSDCPSVLTLPLPEDAAENAVFLRHIWAFDRPRVTEADRRRAEQYRERAERRRAERQAGTFAEFLASLELQVRIEAIRSDQIPRAAQLIQRTNQMNFSSVRRGEAELGDFLGREGNRGFAVHVSDRFGDYGLVGVMLASRAPEGLAADTFLLSCRALGRGVEHQMIRRLGEYAKGLGAAVLEIAFRETPRNAPAREFLSSFAIVRDGVARLAAEEAARLQWHVPTAPAPAELAGSAARGTARRFDDFVRLANELRTVEQIGARMKTARRERTEGRINGATAEPASDLERAVAAIWKELLGVNGIGREDSFFDLGGHSLLAVQLLSRVRREFGLSLSLEVVYGAPLTVAELARAIELGELGAISPAEYEALLQEIEAMPEDQVRACLEAEEGRERG